MGHERIHLPNDASWEQSKELVVYELDRAHSNIHDLRKDIAGVNLDLSSKIKAVDDGSDANTTALAVLETKVLLYGAAAGFVTGIVSAVCVALLLRKMIGAG